ncbi:Zinc finger BED domain-containing protein 1 [Merluccius polli]|uniref:Zinc finger BED domain-containing protein 1 n=1 Tax=Merluccius polli TaxID=89951 RepID=A0AA47N061_MERPO|nr:Zinc finger BED domain-containing protein 1 [Merluccius polli]
MVERFLEQQQAVCAVLAENRKKWHLMPKDTDITILETLKEVLRPLSPLTDALSGEQHTTLSSVLPLTWKMFTSLNDEEKDSLLAGEMKSAIRDYLNEEVNDDDKQLLLILNSATYLDPRFKDMFVSLKEEVKQCFLDQVGENAKPNRSQSHVPDPGQEEDSNLMPQKKQKGDLRRLLSSVQGEKKGSGATPSTPGEPLSRSDKLKDEYQVYEKMPEISAEEDPLSWWKTNAHTLPQLSDFARNYLCIAASSCASERVFSTSGLIVSPRRSRLTHENIDMLVFLSTNLELTKKFKNP